MKTQILLTIPDDYLPENSDISEETTPFNMVRVAMEHFNIPCDLIVCDRMRKSWPFKHCERHIEIEK